MKEKVRNMKNKRQKTDNEGVEKEGMKEGRKEGRKDRGKEGTKRGRKNGRKRGTCILFQLAVSC